MKKIFLVMAAALMTAGIASAQDMSQATEIYNNGAMALQMGDNQGALDAFTQALTMAEACGEEGVDIVNNCKDIIPKIVLSIGKDLIKDSKYDEAVAQLTKAVEVATQYGNADIVTEATDLIPQVAMQKANSLLNSKNFAAAAEAYKQLIALDPTNGTAHLRLGQALNATGNIAEAEAAFNEAIKNGQEKQAVKQLSNMYVKLSAASLKAKKYDEAIKQAVKSNEYAENATAMKVAGTAASQLKDNKGAIEYLEKYLALAPNAKDASQMYYTIAALAQGLGDNAKACGYYQKITSDPKFGETAKAQIAALKCN